MSEKGNIDHLEAMGKYFDYFSQNKYVSKWRGFFIN